MLEHLQNKQMHVEDIESLTALEKHEIMQKLFCKAIYLWIPKPVDKNAIVMEDQMISRLSSLKSPLISKVIVRNIFGAHSKKLN